MFWGLFGAGFMNSCRVVEGSRRAIFSMAHPILRSLALTALVLGWPTCASAVVVTDDFSDMNDTADPAWTHLDGLLGSTGQSWDATTGVYRLSAPSNGFENYGFVGSQVGPEYTDVRVSVDIVEFYTIFAPPNGPEFVNVLARSNGDNNLLSLTGYGYGYDPVANANNGEIVLYRHDANDPANDLLAQRVTLDETKDYRFILEVIGDSIHGQAIEIGSGRIVADSFQKIANATNVYASGTSGVYAYTQSPFSTLFAVDNFRAEEALAGDYNRDGSVDAADYVVWRDTVGQQTPQLVEMAPVEPDDPPQFQVMSLGDMRANGAVSGTCNHTTSNCEIIDDADYEVWRANFGRTVSGSAVGGGAAVPEPASAALALMGLLSASAAVAQMPRRRSGQVKTFVSLEAAQCYAFSTKRRKYVEGR
jgi:hypothetical protein